MKVFEGVKVPIKAWVDGVELEEQAKAQLTNLSSMPFAYKHIAVMPDVHWGMGATVGSVFATVGAVIPAAVGVDIGCGMVACLTSLTANDLPDSLASMRSAIEEVIPHGRSDNGGYNDCGRNQGKLPDVVVESFTPLHSHLRSIVERHPKLDKAAEGSIGHMGTLGTGNHFIELCLDESNRVWIMLHSGSRGIGNAIGTYFINKAKEDMKKYFINLPDADLAYLPEGSQYFNDYIEAVHWAQEFARANREAMMKMTVSAIEKSLGRSIGAAILAVNCHHNYVSKEKHFGQEVLLTRKGAVSAKEGELGIIPGSMGAKSFIVRGKGNRESFCSCSHGAGRRHSRNKAKEMFTLEDHAKATAGVECRKDVEVLDETPAAYKDIDAVMAAQADLVDIVHTLKQVLCVKG